MGATRILVVPFSTTDRDPHGLWVGEAAAVLIGDALRGIGLRALTRPERVDAFMEVNLPSDASLSYASLIRVGQIVGATDLIVGNVRVSGSELVIDARRIRLDTGRVQEQTTDKSPLRDLFALHERVARRLMGSAAPMPPSSEWPPLEVFELYIKGLIAEQNETRINFLQKALAAHPRYDRAQLALWEAFTEQGDHQRALVAAQGVPPTSRLLRRARFAAGLSLVELRRHDEAFAAFKALSDEQPTGSLQNNLGVVQVRRGATPQTGRATYFFTKASELDAEEPDYFFNLGYAYWLERDLPAAVYWLREAVRRNTADGDAHYVLGAALQATGSASEAARERELARQLSSKYSEWEKRPTAATDPVPKGLERLAGDLERLHGARLDLAALGAAQREQAALAGFHLDRGRRLFNEEQNREALAELRKAVYLAPYDAEPHLLIGRLYLRTGQPKEAIDALRVSLWSKESAAGRVALAEALFANGEPDASKIEASRALELDPGNAEAKALLARLDKR
jgi:tetratricopeptide (TPR) repeat protein